MLVAPWLYLVLSCCALSCCLLCDHCYCLFVVSVFGLYGDRGYTWRYVPNERISSLKLEKVINPDLHIDTDYERAAKLQALIDLNQDEKIAKNTDAINELRK